METGRGKIIPNKSRMQRNSLFQRVQCGLDVLGVGMDFAELLKKIRIGILEILFGQNS